MRVFCLLLIGALIVGAQPPAGFVLELEGAWTLEGATQPLSKGQHLNAGAIVQNNSPSDYDRIVMANLNGDVVKTIKCKNGSCHECAGERGACLDPIRPLNPSKPAEGPMAASFRAVMELFVGKPDRYSAHRVRGEGLSENVLPCQGDQCDLSSAFAQVDKGVYYVRFASLSTKDWRSEPIVFDWDPSHPVPLSLPAVRPGVYDLALLEKTETGYSPMGTDAWVLLDPPGSYGPDAEAFRQAKARSAQWGDRVTANTARAYLRANLEYLANRMQDRHASHAQR